MNVPKLRFPEFDGQWEVKRLSDLFPQVRNGFVGTATPFYDDNGIAYLQGKNIKSGAIDPKGLIRVTEVFHLKQKKSQLKARDLLMVQSGHVGECAVVTQEFVGANCHALVVMTPTEKVASEFVRDLFYAPAGKRQIDKIKTGNTIEHVLTSDLKPLLLPIPSLPEQKKIAAFLGVVDAKIAALRARRDGLERYKRGLMRALFSQTLRFTKPDGTAFPAWEEKRLGELLTIRYGKDHKDIPDGEIPVFGTGGIMRYVDRSLHDGPSVLIGRKGTLDKPRYVTHPFWTVDTLFYSDIKRGYLPFFVFLVVQSINWLKHNEATGVPSLSATAIQSVKVFAPPHLNEQQKIADALSAIDAKIAAVGDQVTQMEAFKKGLLQQMFV